MPQTPDGARKLKAQYLGLTLDELTEKEMAGLAWCSRCRQWKPIADFARNRARRSGINNNCQACAYVRKTPGPTLRERRDHKALGLAWCIDCEDWCPLSTVSNSRCREHNNAVMRRRYHENPDFRNRRQQSVYQRKKSIDAVPLEWQELLFELFQDKCAYCDQPPTTWDHITPVAKGGETSFGNVVPCCKSCNSSKKMREVGDWLKATGREVKWALIERISLAHALGER